MQEHEVIERRPASEFQVEQISIGTLNRLFEVDSGSVRFDQLSYLVNFDSISLNLERVLPEQASARGDSSLRFLIRAQDGIGYKQWAIDETGRCEPTIAKLNGSPVANPYDMGHLNVETLVGYVAERLGISKKG